MSSFTIVLKGFYLSLLLLAGAGALYGQYHIDPMGADGEWRWGIKLGGTYGKINNLKNLRLPGTCEEDRYQASSTERVSLFAGLVFFKRFKKSKVAVQPEITYHFPIDTDREGFDKMEGVSDFEYLGDDDSNYRLQFNYEYLDIGCVVKLYPTGGLHFLFGPQLRVITNDPIKLRSNREQPIGPFEVSDLQLERNLQESLAGRSDISLLAGIGLDISETVPLSFELRYRLGCTDLIRTLANGHGLTSTKNTNRAFQFCLQYTFPFSE